jgi:cell wall-associated NlpC family hydrolase
MKNVLFYILLVIVAWFSAPVAINAQSHFEEQQAAYRKQIVDSIISRGKQYLGKPYRYQGANTNIMDCSGFICQIMQPFDRTLPRSSASMAQVVKKIPLTEVQAGDLLFFKGRSLSSTTVGHVAMVVDVLDNGIIRMMHSTVTNGIIIENYPSQYYRERFMHAGRITSIDKIIEERISVEKEALPQ